MIIVRKSFEKIWECGALRTLSSISKQAGKMKPEQFATVTSHLTSLHLPLQDEDPQYGGCEGPDATYVKLRSSDNHEFIVKREHALTSGTIRNMLSGPGQFKENETNEVTFKDLP